MRTIAAILTALLVIAGGLVCATPQEEGRHRSTAVLVVENQNYRMAGVDVFCGHVIERIHQVQTSHKVREEIELPRSCREMTFIIDLSGSGGHQIAGPVLVQPGECWRLIIGHRLRYTTWQPCREA